MLIKLVRISVVPMILMISPNIYAQSDLESTLVTGVYAPAPVAASTASVSILDSAIIRKLNKRSVADLLNSVPGLLVEQQGGPGGLTAVSIRGGESNFTLVLMDGVAMNDPTNSRGGGVDFSNIDPELVERIEVVLGPQSAIYGSDALAGVINIITRRGAGDTRQNVRVEAGEKGLSNIHIGLAGESSGWQYAFDFSRRDAGEQTQGSRRDVDHVNVRLAWRPDSQQRFTAAYRYLEGESTTYPEQSGGPDFSVNDELDESKYTETVYSLGWHIELSSLWHSALTANYFEREDDYVSPGIYPYSAVPPNRADSDFQRSQVQWVNTFNVNDRYQFNVGADYRKEVGDSVGSLEFSGILLPTSFSLSRDTTGVFADIHAEPLPGVLLQASVRYDSPEQFSDETTVKLGAKYRINQHIELSANWGEGFKLPSFFALGHALVGNPELKPETARSWDLGATLYFTDDFDVELSYFDNDYENLVTFDPDLFINVNRAQVVSSGMEVQLSWDASDQLHLQAQSTYTDIDVKNSSSVLLGRPEWKAGVIGLWAFSPSWTSALDYQWSGQQYASSLYTGDTVFERLDDFSRLDWNLRWQARNWLMLEFAVDNVLDDENQTAVGFRAPGRLFRMSVTLRNVPPS